MKAPLAAVSALIVLLAGAAASLLPDRSPCVVRVPPVVETAPVPSRGDAADDPAIWVHPEDSSLSTIIGTDKRGGLAVYDLHGRQIQYAADGPMVNVDLRDGFSIGEESFSLVTAGDRARDVVWSYVVEPTTRQLRRLAARPIRPGLEVHGSCMYRSALDGSFYVFVNSKSGHVEQWRLFATESGFVDGTLLRGFDVGSEVEGCVADDELGHLYISEENVGIWKYAAEPLAGTARTLVDAVGRNGYLAADVEGLALYRRDDGTGYLVASSQGNDSFVVYRREDGNAYVATFVVREADGIDEVTHADGIEAVSAALGARFPAGIFVTQDDGNDGWTQNFKLVSWSEIQTRIEDGCRPPS